MSIKSIQSTILVVGSDGQIGSSLIMHLRKSGVNVIGTTKHRELVNNSRIYLDLSEDMGNWSCPEQVKTAIICAGVTKIDLCQRDPALTSLINVDRVSSLINKLVENNIFVIYLSTNQVFDGTMPYRRSEEPTSPATEYGRQKVEVEQNINKFGDAVAIVRFSKVLGSNIPLIAEWKEDLKSGRTISPFSDMTMAPIPLSSALSVLHLLCELRLPGLLQVSGNLDISYSEAAYFGARLLGVDPNLIQPVTAQKSIHFTGYAPKYTSLNIDRLKNDLGIEPPDVWWTIEKAFLQPQILAGVR